MTRDKEDRIRDPDPLGGRPSIERLDIGERSYLVAPVQPLDVTGGRTVTVGIVIWTVTLLVLLPFYGTLRDDGNLWWLWTCVAGIGLGLLGRAYCNRRAESLKSNPRPPESSPIGAAGL